MLEECGTQDLSSLGCCQPEFSTPIVFSGRAKEKLLFAVFCIGIGATFVWFAMYQCLHPNWNKWMFVVDMMAIDMCVGGQVGM
jgi:hypothetical protein